MTHVGPWFVAIAMLCAMGRTETMAARKPHYGVFGTINGKKFNASNVARSDDPCVNGIYDRAQGTVVFAAIECHGKRRRQGTAVKKNYKILVMACTSFTPGVVPPYEIPCGGSAYTQTKTGRFRIPKSTTTWGANFDFTDISHPTSNVRMRVDSFDGTNLRGAIVGVFEVPLQGPASPPAPITGEVQFNFPFKLQ